MLSDRQIGKENKMTEDNTQNVAEEQYWGDDAPIDAPEPQAETSNVEENPEVVLEPFEDEVVQEQVANSNETAGEQTEQQRFEYWQSRYDKKASEVDAISEKLKSYENVAPIAEYIQSNPEVLKQVAKSLSGDTQSVPSQEKSDGLPKKPQRPTKPMNYDASEAVMDADSDSYQYRVALDDYRDGMIDYQEGLEVARINAMKAQEQKVVQQRQAYERQQAEVGMRQQLQQQYGYSPEKAEEFMQFYSTPESITLENLVHLDKLRGKPSQQQIATQQKVQAMQNQQKRMQVPTPTAVQTGNAQPNFSDEDLFNLGLMANSRK